MNPSPPVPGPSTDPDKTLSQESFPGVSTPALSEGSASRYRVVRPHAKGGLGEVFVAADAELGREVALKTIQSARADDADCRRRFVREAEITGRLEHPGVVPVHGLGADAD